MRPSAREKKKINCALMCEAQATWTLACRFSKHRGQTAPTTAPRGQSSVGHTDMALPRRQRPKEKHWPGQKVPSLKVLNAFAQARVTLILKGRTRKFCSYTQASE